MRRKGTRLRPMTDLSSQQDNLSTLFTVRLSLSIRNFPAFSPIDVVRRLSTRRLLTEAIVYLGRERKCIYVDDVPG